jgi:hypothetical protein
VWGHGVVAQSGHPQLAIGTRVYGLLPMSTHVVMTPGDPRGEWFRDAARRRAELSPVYNAYRMIDGWDTDRRDRHALLAPVFVRSFLDALLAEHEQFAAERVVVTSASSKVALGLAHLLRRRGTPIVGLTSARNARMVQDLGVYGTVVTYDDIDDLDDRTTTVVDVAGDQTITNAVSRVLGDGSVTISTPGSPTAPRMHTVTGGDARSTRFLAPDQMVAHTREWGRARFEERFAAAFAGLAGWTTTWLRLVRASGPGAVEAAYHRARRAQVGPTEGIILSLHATMPDQPKGSSGRGSVAPPPLGSLIRRTSHPV